MKKTIFRKENVFTCVMFGALVIFVVVESIVRPDGIAVVAFMVAVSVFALSAFKLAADVAENVNDVLTTHMRSVQNWDDYTNPQFKTMREAAEDEANRMIEEMASGCEDRDRAIGMLRSYRVAYQAREKARVIRRALLWIYYSVFMLLFASLLLHGELAQPLNSVVMADSDIASVITLWSLVIVLFEVMMKGLIAKAMVSMLEQRFGFEMELL